MCLVSLVGVAGGERCRGHMMEGPGFSSERDGSRWGVAASGELG